MAGTPIMLEKVLSPEPRREEPAEAAADRETRVGKNKEGAKVVSLAQRKKAR